MRQESKGYLVYWYYIRYLHSNQHLLWVLIIRFQIVTLCLFVCLFFSHNMEKKSSFFLDVTEVTCSLSSSLGCEINFTSRSSQHDGGKYKFNITSLQPLTIMSPTGGEREGARARQGRRKGRVHSHLQPSSKKTNKKTQYNTFSIILIHVKCLFWLLSTVYILGQTIYFFNLCG